MSSDSAESSVRNYAQAAGGIGCFAVVLFFLIMGALSWARSPFARPVESVKLQSGQCPAAGTRLFVYRHTDSGFGGSPPDKVESVFRSESRSYVHREVATQPHEGPVDRRTLGWLVAYFGSLALLSVVSLRVLFGLGANRGRTAGWIVVDLALLILFAFTGVAGYASGSSFVFDNATGGAVEIHVNGSHLSTLPAEHYRGTRIAGSRIRVELRGPGGIALESAELEPDTSLFAKLKRAYVGSGEYVYNICGANDYRIEHVGYVTKDWL